MIYSIRYTDDMPKDTGGYARAWLIRIRPRYKDDKGIHNHELCHVAQFWRTCGLHGLFYLLSKKYKLNAEVEAYREQLKYEPAATDPEHYRDMYAGFIADNYNLDISKGEVLKIL
jgi:hypothetical protein